MVGSSFFALGDRYYLQARVLPAVLCLLPIIVSLYVAVPSLATMFGTLGGLVATLALSLLLSRLVRNSGASKEAGLFRSWGGTPTTILLRHTDSTIDPLTKQRYHAFLANAVGVSMPSPDAERADTPAADLLYESCVRRLREMTRDHKRYPRVFDENVMYGFSRNLWAIKPWGIVVTACTLALDAIVTGLDWPSHEPAYAILSVSVMAYLLVWVFGISASFVRSAAWAYARALLATCEGI